MSGFLVLGGGGHAKVVADILQCQGHTVAGFLDDDASKWGEKLLGLPILGGVRSFSEHALDGLVLGIGSNKVRQKIATELGPAAANLWGNAIHPRATVAASAQLGKGVVVAAGAVINPDAVIGDHVIINTGATVDHDAVIGDYAHIAPGVHLAGGVRVGEGTLVGVGASVIPYRSIGDWVQVGAGAVIISDVPSGVTVVGVPGRW